MLRIRVINWRYFSSHAYNTMSTHLSGLHPWTIKSGLFVNMISNSLLLCAMKRIYWPRLWSFRGEREKGLLTFFTSVSSNIIHKLQIYYFIYLWNIILQEKSYFLSEYLWQKRNISYQTEGVQNFKSKCTKSCRPIVEMFILLNNYLLFGLTNEHDLWLKENHS